MKKTKRRRTVDVRLDYGHPVGGQGTGLVRADRGRVSHSLTGIQVADQVVVQHHLLDGIGQGQGDGQGQTLGHGHHEDGDSDDEEVDKVLKRGN